MYYLIHQQLCFIISDISDKTRIASISTSFNNIHFIFYPSSQFVYERIFNIDKTRIASITTSFKNIHFLFYPTCQFVYEKIFKPERQNVSYLFYKPLYINCITARRMSPKVHVTTRRVGFKLNNSYLRTLMNKNFCIQLF